MRKIYAKIPFWSSNVGKKFRVGMKGLKIFGSVGLPEPSIFFCLALCQSEPAFQQNFRQISNIDSIFFKTPRDAYCGTK